MKVLLYRWKVFNQEDIKEAFEAFNAEVTVYEASKKNKEYDGNANVECESELIDAIKEHDCVFSVNYFAHLSQGCQEAGKKYICWTVDSPMLSMYHKSVYNECNYIFIFDMFCYKQMKALGLKNVWYLPLAVNTARVSKETGKAMKCIVKDGVNDSETGSAKGKAVKVVQGYNDEISFVGGLYYKNSYDAMRDSLSDGLRDYFDHRLAKLVGNYSMEEYDNLLTVDILAELMEQVEFKKDELSFTDLGMIFQTTVLGYKLAQLERIEALNLLTETGQVSLYSDKYSSRLKNVIYKGTVSYMDEMPDVFRKSKINLNLTIRNIRTGLPLRMWDIMGAGGFMLTNRQLELNAYFEEGKECAAFGDFYELQKKAEYYLSHDDERESIAAAGLRKVAENHTYIHRIKYILENVFQGISFRK